MRYAKELIFALAVVLAVWVAIGQPAGTSAVQAQTFGIMLITLAIWGTGLVPGYVGSSFLFAALILGGLATPQEVFGSFSSTAVWLVVAGFVIGAAITHSGLGAKIGAVAQPHLSRNYATLIAGLMLLGMALGFVMPSSMGRAAVLVPVGMALADALGLERGSKGRTGVAIIIALGTNMPSFAILPSNIPNIILSGVAEQSFGLHFSYAHYLLLHYPVLGLLKSAVIVGLVLALFPAVLRENGTQTQKASGSGWRQVALMAILLVTLALWATDQAAWDQCGMDWSGQLVGSHGAAVGLCAASGLQILGRFFDDFVCRRSFDARDSRQRQRFGDDHRKGSFCGAANASGARLHELRLARAFGGGHLGFHHSARSSCGADAACPRPCGKDWVLAQFRFDDPGYWVFDRDFSLSGWAADRRDGARRRKHAPAVEGHLSSFRDHPIGSAALGFPVVETAGRDLSLCATELHAPDPTTVASFGAIASSKAM